MAYTDYLNTVQDVYIGYYARPGDPQGLIFWATQLNNVGGNLNAIINAFANSAEAQSLYGPINSSTISTVVNQFYVQDFNRGADPVGLAYYVNGFNSGKFTAGTIALNVLFGATGADAVTIQNKLTASNEFTNTVNPGLNGVNIQATYTNPAAGRAFLTPVTSNVSTIPTQAATTTYVQASVALATDPINTFVLTTGLDVAQAANFAGSETQFLVDGKGVTLNPGDRLTGVFGRTDNTLTVTDLTPNVAEGNIPAGVSLTNIQNVVLNSSNNTAGGIGFSTVGFAGVLNTNVTTNGGASDLVSAANGASGSAVTVTHNGFTGNLNAVGGTNVTATSEGGNVFVGNPTQVTRVPLANEVATGAVVVNQNNSGAGITGVYGGTTVTVNVTSTSNTGTVDIGNTPTNTGNSAAGAIANSSGNITLVDAGTGAATMFGGANVTVNNTALKGAGAITVGDNTATVASNEPTGAVTVTETNKIAYDGQTGATHNNTVSGAIGVYGGTTATVTTNGGGTVAVGAATVTGAKPSGAVNITTTGISNATAAGAITEAGGTDVTVTAAGGAVTIGRQNSAKGTAADNPTGAVNVTETISRGLNPLVAQTNTITVDGGTTVNVTAENQIVSIGGKTGPTGAITVTQSGILTGQGYTAGYGAVTANGGTNVTVNTTGGSVAVGAHGATNILPSGTVTVNDTYSGANGDVIAVQGGTTTGITTTYTRSAVTAGHADAIVLDPTGAALKNAAIAPTGNVTIIDVTAGNSIDGKGTATQYYGTGATNVYTNGGSTVSITGGAVGTVTDIQSTLATGGAGAGKAVGTSKLATVVLDGVQTGGAVTINSDALANLSILDNNIVGNTFTITDNTAGHALTLTQGNNHFTAKGDGKGDITVTDAKAGTVTVTDNGKASNGTLTLITTAATGLTVNNAAAANLNLANDTALTGITLTGAGDVALTGSDALTKLTSVDASASKGAVTFSGSNANTGFAPTATNGVVQTFTGGSGVTTVVLASNAVSWGDSVKITGGSGSSDVLVANYAAGATDVALGSGSAAVKNFENLGLGANATSAGGNYDASGFSGVTLGAVAGNVVITNAAKNASLSITAAPGFTTAFKGANTTSTSDALTINVGTSTTTGINASTVTANGYEAVTINSAAKAATNTNTMTLVDAPTSGTASAASALTLTVGGSAGLTLTDGTTLFTAMTSTDTAAVNLNAVAVSNSGAAIAGGAGALQATGATGGTEVIKMVLDGTGAKTFVIGDTWVVTLGGSTFTYTAAAADTAVQAATYMAAAINAGATTGPVILAGGNPAVTASVSGAALLLTKAATFQAFSTFGGGNTGTVTIGTTALVGGSEQQLITITVPTTAAAGNTATATINGTAAVFTAAATDTATTVATGLAAAINALTTAQKIGLTSAVASGNTVVLTGGANGIFSSTAGTTTVGQITTTIGNTAINYATANDSFTAGAGGGTYTAGLGGSWGTTLHRYSSGSETVNLTASAAKVDTLRLADGNVITNNGTLGGATGFTTGSLTASDKLSFTTAGKTPIANVSLAGAVSAVTGAGTMANKLDPSGALFTALANLTYTVTNGVITFSATGGHTLSDFTTAQLISAAEIIVNSSTSGNGANKMGIFSTGGDTYVVASDAGNTLAGAGNADDADSLTQLIGVASSTGFGVTGAQGTVVIDPATFTFVQSGVVNGGSAAVATYDETGFSADTITAAKFGTVSTAINNLAPSAKLTLNDSGATLNTPVSVTQTGTAGQNSLTLAMPGGDVFTAITVTGDGLLVLAPTAVTTINSLADGGGTNTLGTIAVQNTATLTVKAITDTALTAVDLKDAGAAVILGNGTALGQTGVAFSLPEGQNATITASGNNDTFADKVAVTGAASTAGGAGAATITASGAGDVFTLTSTSAGNTITANGAGDTFTLGNTAATGGYTVTATGAGDTVNFSATHTGASTVDTGSNAVVTFGAGNEKIIVGGDATGGNSSSYAFDTLKNVTTGAGKALDFTTAGIADGALGSTIGGGQTLSSAQVNVSSATTLAQALDMAANITALTQTPGTDAGTTAFSASYVYGNGVIAAGSGVIDWFQFGGDTYIVEAVNNAASAAAHTALGANDVVAKVSGLVDLSASTFNNGTHVLTA